MARVQKRGPNHRRRISNRTETKADALMLRNESIPDEVVARKRTGSHGEVLVVEAGSGGVLVVAGNHSLPMADVESALSWLDNL